MVFAVFGASIWNYFAPIRSFDWTGEKSESATQKLVKFMWFLLIFCTRVQFFMLE